MNPDSDGAVPSILRRPNVDVTFPNGTSGTIANPLYRYDFHPLNYDDFSILVCLSLTLFSRSHVHS
jgi:tyrosinase